MLCFFQVLVQLLKSTQGDLAERQPFNSLTAQPLVSASHGYPARINVFEFRPRGGTVVQNRRRLRVLILKGVWRKISTQIANAFAEANSNGDFMKLLFTSRDDRGIGEALAKGGHQVIFSIDSEDALARIKIEDFDLVLLDLDFPNSEKDKINLLMAFKSTHPEIRVVTFTSSNSFELEKAIREHGVISYMTKPVNVSTLKSIVKHLEERVHKARIG